MIGELSFIDDEAHTSTVLSLGDSMVIQFTADNIRPLILKEPQLMFDFMRAVIKRVHTGVKAIVMQQNILSEYIVGKART